MPKQLLWLILPALLASCTATTATTATTPADTAPAAPTGTQTITVVGVNDFHGNLEPGAFRGVKVPDPKDPTKTVSAPAGGIEALGGKLAEIRAENPATVFVGVGDLTGASPLSSSLLADEPTVLAMSRLGMAVNVLGNHELDYGVTELQRFQKGGCESVRPDKACKFDNAFPGASYTYIAANVFDKANRTVFPAYRMVEVGGERVAFVGAVLRDTPSVVTPSGVAGLTFADEAESINAVLPEIMAQQPAAVIALIHQGGQADAGWDKAACDNLQGPITDVVRRLDPRISAVMTGHTHQAYNCLVDGRVVIQGASQGHLLQRLDLTVDRAQRKVVSVQAQNVFVDAGGPKDPAMTALLERAQGLTKPIASRTVATLAAPVSRTANAAGESALGNLVADAQLAATRAPENGGAQIAFMNPGGIRADLPSTGATAVTFGDVFTVQPFGNLLTVVTLSGAEIRALLEQQFDNPSAGSNRILQVSEGFRYTWDAARPAGSRVTEITLNGRPLDMAAQYRVTVNSFLADGGDNFTVLREGRDRLGGGLDVDALQNYLQAGKVAAPAQNRITRLN